MKNTTGEYEFIIAHTSLQEQKAEQAINNLPRDIEEQAKSIENTTQASEGAIPPQTTQKSDSDSNGIDNEDDDVDEGIAQEEDNIPRATSAPEASPETPALEEADGQANELIEIFQKKSGENVMSEIEQRSGANFQKTDEKGNTLLMLAVGSTKDLNWKIINTTIEYLIDKVDMNKQNNEGSTAMMLAAKNYNVPAWQSCGEKAKKI